MGSRWTRMQAFAIFFTCINNSKIQCVPVVFAYMECTSVCFSFNLVNNSFQTTFHFNVLTALQLRLSIYFVLCCDMLHKCEFKICCQCFSVRVYVWVLRISFLHFLQTPDKDMQISSFVVLGAVDTYSSRHFILGHVISWWWPCLCSCQWLIICSVSPHTICYITSKENLMWIWMF